MGNSIAGNRIKASGLCSGEVPWGPSEAVSLGLMNMRYGFTGWSFERQIEFPQLIAHRLTPVFNWQ